MKKGEKKKQAKALAKRTERKSAKKAQQVAAAEGELRPIRQARKYPLEGCWVQSGWQEAGLAVVVVVARRQPNGLLVFGNLPGGLLLPRREELPSPAPMSCLQPCSTRSCRELIPGETRTPITPALAHELIYGSIGYAARYGFRPDPDFALAQLVLDPTRPVSAHRDSDFSARMANLSTYPDHATMWNAVVNTLMRTASCRAISIIWRTSTTPPR